MHQAYCNGAHPCASHSFDLNQKKRSIKAAHQHTKGSGILRKKLQAHSHITAILVSCVTVMSYKAGGGGVGTPICDTTYKNSTDERKTSNLLKYIGSVTKFAFHIKITPENSDISAAWLLPPVRYTLLFSSSNKQNWTFLQRSHLSRFLFSHLIQCIRVLLFILFTRLVK